MRKLSLKIVVLFITSICITTSAWAVSQNELENNYVQSGNQIVFNDLNDLKDRLNITKEAINTLTDIQNLRNQLVPDSREASNAEEAVASKEVEVLILDQLNKSLTKLMKDLSRDEKKLLKKSFKAFRKAEKKNDHLITSFDDALFIFALVSSEEQGEILINAYCAEDETLKLCQIEGISNADFLELQSDLQALYTENQRTRRSIVSDDAKQFQSQVNQSQDAASQQANMATSILQNMSGLLATIFR